LIPVPGAHPLKIFHVNDSTDDQVLFQAACKAGNVPFNWQVTDSAEKAIAYLKALVELAREVPVAWPDLILLDVVMPAVSGLEVLRFIRGTAELKHLLVVVLTGALDPQCEQQSMRLGANLFLAKPTPFREVVDLARALYQLVRHMRETEGVARGLRVIGDLTTEV